MRWVRGCGEKQRTGARKRVRWARRCVKSDRGWGVERKN